MSANSNPIGTAVIAIVSIMANLALVGCEEQRPPPPQMATATPVMQQVTNAPSPISPTPFVPSPTSPPVASQVPSAVTPSALATGTPGSLPATATPRPPATNTPLPATATRTALPAAPTSTPVAPPQPTSAPSPFVRRLIAVPGNPLRLYAVTTDSRFARSDDGGATWARVPVAATGATALSGLGIDYRNPKTLYVTTNKGVFRSEDDGQTWSQVSGEFRQDITVSFDDSQVLWSVATTVSGRFFSNYQIMRSNDGGQTWRGASDGIYRPQVNSFILIDPQDANALFVTATIGESRAPYPSVYRGTRDGYWQSIVALPRYCCFLGYGLAWSSFSRTLYTGTLNGKLYSSSNPKEADVAKVEWREVFDFGEPRSFVHVLARGEPDETLYVSLVDANASRGKLMKSPDGGKTWVQLSLP